LAEGEDANRVQIAAFVIEHHQEILPNDYELRFKDSGGTWHHLDRNCTLQEAAEVARCCLPRKHVVYFSIWPQLNLKFKTEVDEKKVFDF